MVEIAHVILILISREVVGIKLEKEVVVVAQSVYSSSW